MKRMTNQILLPAKATTDAEQSNAIVVSFAAQWHQHLLAKDFSLVIRKRVPKRKTFEWLYFHINSPVSEICGRAGIQNICDLTVEQAVTLSSKIRLSPEEIKSYIGEDRHVGCYKLDGFQFGNKPVHTTELAARMIYHPPESFFILSKRSQEIIDQMAGFVQPDTAHARRAQNT